MLIIFALFKTMQVGLVRLVASTGNLLITLGVIVLMLVGISSILGAAVGDNSAGSRTAQSATSGLFKLLERFLSLSFKGFGWLFKKAVNIVPKIYRSLNSFLIRAGVPAPWSKIISAVIIILV